MSVKSYKYNELGSKRCVKCSKKLKRRIIEEHPKFDLCYRCFKGLPPKKEENINE